MHSSSLLSICFLLLGSALGRQAPAALQVETFMEKYHQSSLSRLVTSPLEARSDQRFCTPDNVRVRKSWTNLTLDERKEYIDAVKCLRNKPAITPTSFAPGARNRMDDFTASHINQTLYIHFSGWVLPWHRYFLWHYETVLREECGYTGSQPYWDWTEHNDDLTRHPLFDGSDYSVSGNGVYVEQELVNGTVPGVPDPQIITRPPGTGGGCVVDGPFANITLTMGLKFPYGQRNRTGLEYTPHCMTRDFLPGVSKQVLTKENVATLVSQPSVGDFLRILDYGVADSGLGLHIGGHTSIGGDAVDLWASPQDPAFYFHHAQIDRLWAVWQEQSPRDRLYAVSGTRTWANSPPSSNATLSDVLEFGYAGGQAIMASVVDPIGGLLCYRYE